MSQKSNSAQGRAEAYSDAEFDRAFFRTLGSNLTYILTRVAMIIVVYWLVARAILHHDLTPAFLFLPLTVEVLSMCWLGFFLSRTFIDCSAFRKTAGHGTWSVVFTLIVFIVASGIVMVEDQTVHWNRFVPGWRAVGQRIVETGLYWPMLVGAISLLVATVPEVQRWRRVGGKFVWTPVFDLSLRIAALLLIFIAGFFLMPLLATSLGSWILDRPGGTSWLVFGLLLLVELGGLAMAVKIHKDLTDKEKLWLSAEEAR